MAAQNCKLRLSYSCGEFYNLQLGMVEASSSREVCDPEVVMLHWVVSEQNLNDPN